MQPWHSVLNDNGYPGVTYAYTAQVLTDVHHNSYIEKYYGARGGREGGFLLDVPCRCSTVKDFEQCWTNGPSRPNLDLDPKDKADAEAGPNEK